MGNGSFYQYNLGTHLQVCISQIQISHSCKYVVSFIIYIIVELFTLSVVQFSKWNFTI